MSGKKGRKVKGKTVDLGEFLNEGGNEVQKGFAVVQRANWDDESSGGSLGRILLPTAPISTRGGNVDETKVPREPPFVAFLGNLPFEIAEEEVENFFGELKLTSVRLARDSSERFKGFGYAEFDDRKALIEALGKDGDQLRNREVRVCLPENENDSRGGAFGRDRGMRGTGFGSRGERPIERELPNDWRASAREDRGSERDSSYNRSDRYERREGGFGDRDRGGGDDSRDWRSDSRGFSGRYEPPRDREESSSAPAERPRLKIAPRTKPVEEIKVTDEPEPVKKPERPKIEKPKAADIFGAAKPVDTAAKLKEIEARIEAKQKEEAEKAKLQEKNEQTPRGPSKETSPRHEQADEEPAKKWRDEIRDEKEKKLQIKQKSERKVAPQTVEEPEFNPTSKNKYADLDVSENQDESEDEDGIQAEN